MVELTHEKVNKCRVQQKLSVVETMNFGPQTFRPEDLTKKLNSRKLRFVYRVYTGSTISYQ